MTQSTVHLRTSRAELRKVLAQLPKIISSGSSDARAVLTRIGLTALGRIKRAFITKSRGGTDEAGDRWAPLSPKTIAYSRRGRSKTEKGRSSRPSQALNAKQQARWWQLYRQGLAVHKGNKGNAAKWAWGILKREGATTLLQKYGTRQVEILRDTGLLLNSLSPGFQGTEQVFRVENGVVVIGTNRKGAAAHHKGVPGRLPQRRLWPPPNRWPANWWLDIVEQAKQGLLEIATKLMRGAT